MHIEIGHVHMLCTNLAMGGLRWELEHFLLLGTVMRKDSGSGHYWAAEFACITHS